MLKHSDSVFCFLIIVIFVNGEVIYTVTGPGTIRSNVEYNVVVAVYETGGPCELQVGISSSTYNVTKVVNIQPMSIKNVKLQLPKLEDDDYKLIVKGISGISIENSTDLNFAEYKPLVFIQTDKATYKPGDLVQFRVLFLNEYTRAAELNRPVTISIIGGDNNRIETIKNVNPIQGVYTGKFQLSERTKLGVWEIVVFTGDEVVKRNIFRVEEYELPKFQVVLDTEKNVALEDEVIRVIVRSKYTFGKSVKGKANVSIEGFLETELSQKVIMIDGKGYAEFNIPEDLKFKKIFPKQLKVNVEFEETLTGNKENVNTEITLHKYNYIITAIDPPKTYEPEKLTTYTVAVKKLDGSPIKDKKNPVVLGLDDLEFSSQLDKNGVATFTFKLPKKDKVTVYCKYLDHEEYFDDIKYGDTELSGELQLKLNTQKPQVGADLFVDVTWTEPIKYFIYTLTARGRIITAEQVEVTENNKFFTIKFHPTFEMMPKVTILVQYIYNNNLRFEEKSIDIEREFENTLNLISTVEAIPGDNIEFKISTDPNSFVGLLGVDQSVLLLRSGNDLSMDDIFESLKDYSTKTPWTRGRGRYPGKVSGLVTLTNANYPYSYPSKDRRIYTYNGEENPFTYLPPTRATPPPRAPPTRKPKTTPRKHFQETWLFEDFVITKQSQFNFFKKIPDTITSWIITGFSISPTTGIALMDRPTKIKVFKPFFIAIDLPFSVKQGEVISVPVFIFNYMNNTVDAVVTMDNSDKDYEFTEIASEDEDRPIDISQQQKHISIPSNGEDTVSFMIRVKTTGVITIKVTAVTPLAEDSVHQNLKVEPEGVKQYQNQAFFVSLSDKEEHQETIIVDVPENAVQNSEYIEISAISDLVGLTIKNIENLIRLPYGYGEQNMINFVPSIIVLKYLQVINQNEPNVTRNALNMLKIGYQRELEYKHYDGSYSANGKSDNSGSTWLTAYVVRFFQQADEFSNIDQELITSGLGFLASKQTANGNFAEFGILFEFPRLNEISLTAFVLLTFLENKEKSSEYESYIQNGINFLLADIDNSEDTHSLSITALVLQKRKHPLADEVLTKIKAIARNENGFTWWSGDMKKRKRQTTFHASNNDIEITAYVLLAMLEKELTAEVLPTVKWLIMQRNSKGGFISTQDTVVGLQALVKFAEKTGLRRSGRIDIEYTYEGVGVNDRGKMTVMPENAIVLMSHELPQKTRKVQFTAKGNSSSLVQLSYNYNTVGGEDEQIFRLNISVRPNTPARNLVIDICAEFVPPRRSGEERKTNMVVIEIALPSGFTTSREKLEKLRDMRTVLFTETKSSDTVAIVYLQNLRVGDEKCISVEAVRIYAVAKQKSVPVVIYDYYDRNRRATKYYEVKTSLCEICEYGDCGAGCKNDKELTT